MACQIFKFGFVLLQEIGKYIHNFWEISLIFELGRGMYSAPNMA